MRTKSYGRNKSYCFLTLKIIIVDIYSIFHCDCFENGKWNFVLFWYFNRCVRQIQKKMAMTFSELCKEFNKIELKTILVRNNSKKMWFQVKNEMQKEQFRSRTNAVVDFLNVIFMCWIGSSKLFSSLWVTYTIHFAIWLLLFQSSFSTEWLCSWVSLWATKQIKSKEPKTLSIQFESF